MQTVNIPRTDLYADDEHVVAEWEEDGERYQAQFTIADVEDGDEDDPETVAVFLKLSEMGDVRNVDDGAALDDVPNGVIWAIGEFAHTAIPNDDRPGDRDDDRRGGAFA